MKQTQGKFALRLFFWFWRTDIGADMIRPQIMRRTEREP